MKLEEQKRSISKLISIPEACDLLGGISHWTIRRWLSQGLLSSHKIAKRRLLALEDIEKLIANSRQEATAPHDLRI